MIPYYQFEPPTLPRTARRGKNKVYSENIFTFDIETSSVFISESGAETYAFKSDKYYRACTKAATMYIWQMCIDGAVYFGRTWAQWLEFLEMLQEIYQGILIIYVHNLAFEFSFIKSLLPFDDVFARQPHKPIYARSGRLEFRCSLFLTNMPLAALPKNYMLPIEKLVGDLDYHKARHTKTPLTAAEMEYCKNDVLIIYHLIAKKRREYQHVYNIPYTQTGEVRRVVKRILSDRAYRAKIADMTEDNASDFKFLYRAYAGGYTHANFIHAGQVLHNVKSVDFSSSYPSVMCLEKYPMTHFSDVNITTFEQIRKSNAYLIDVTFYNVKSRTSNTWMSVSKCIEICGGIYDNGRILSADMFRAVLTDVDIEIFCRAYTVSGYEINRARAALYDYLPRPFVEYIAKLYQNKTTLKNVEGKELLYMQSKQYVNSLYGMSVTSTIRDGVTFDGLQFVTEVLTADKITEILQDNKRKNRDFLSYAWGVWVTAYARRNLWRAMLDIGADVIYCDTDSIKYIGAHDDVIERYNTALLARFRKRCRDMDLPLDYFAPADTKGISHPMGIFESDGAYAEFKTLGAKKYAYTLDGETSVHITVSGVSKKAGKLLKDIREFDTGFKFKPEDTEPLNACKNLIFYIDKQEPFALTDYTGNTQICGDMSGACLQPTSYVLDITEEYSGLISHTKSTFLEE